MWPWSGLPSVRSGENLDACARQESVAHSFGFSLFNICACLMTSRIALMMTSGFSAAQACMGPLSSRFQEASVGHPLRLNRFPGLKPSARPAFKNNSHPGWLAGAVEERSMVTHIDQMLIGALARCNECKCCHEPETNDSISHGMISRNFGKHFATTEE